MKNRLIIPLCILFALAIFFCQGRIIVYGTVIGQNGFVYQHDPMVNPKAAADILEDPSTVYGYRPNPESSRLGVYADYDWTDTTIVAEMRKEREEYHASFSELYSIISQMRAEGRTTEEIARAVSTRRNELRLESCKTEEELEKLKQSNLATYGNENGGTPDYFYAKYGSWETVIEKSLSTNAGADACLGLYDLYYDTYIFDCTHKWDTAYIIDRYPNCLKEGTESIHCLECGQIKPDSERSIPRTDHVFGAWKVTKEATTTQTGERTRTCSNCKTSQSEPIPRLTAVSSISISGISKKIAAGKKIHLKVKVLPANAADKRVRWASSNNKIATVDQTGRVSVKKNAGGKNVTIFASAVDGTGINASWKISIMKGAVKKISIKGNRNVKAGETTNLKAVVKTSGKKPVNKKLKWSSYNSKWAKVSNKGKVTTYKEGKNKTVTITAMATDGTDKKKTVKIRIK